MSLRDHFSPQEGRATELDPSTFAHPKDYQRETTGIDWWIIATWSALFLFAGLAWWGIIAGVKAVWNLIF